MATAKKKKKKYDWVKLKAEYQTTNISLRELAEKHGIPWGTVNSRSNKEKWAKDKVEIQNKIETETKQKIIEQKIEENVDYNKRHLDVYDKGKSIIDGLMELYLSNLENGKIRKSDPIYLEKLFNCVEKLQKGERLATGLDDKNRDDGDNEPEMVFVENVDLNKI